MLGASDEFRRLRADFETQASRYSDLTLSVLASTPARPIDKSRFPEPNHAIVLWQYLGQAIPSNDFQLEASDVTAYGLRGALVSTFGIIQGADTELFRRMAYRAGSLVPQAAVTAMNVDLMRGCPSPDADGKAVFAANSNPLAVWLNLLVLCTLANHPQRLRGRTFAVNPFAASLAACDYILRPEDPPQGNTTAKEDTAPKSLSELGLSKITKAHPWIRVPLLGIVVLAALGFVVWNSLPDSTKERIIQFITTPPS